MADESDIRTEMKLVDEMVTSMVEILVVYLVVDSVVLSVCEWVVLLVL